jgi:mono/diheme cytochrome c family protein
MLRSTLLIVICALASTVAFGQDEMAQYQPYMKAVVASFGPLRMAVMAKDTAGAAAAATKLQATFSDVLAFWQKKGASDAIGFATNARDAAKAIAGSTNADDQAASLMKLQQQCGGCHMAHRMGAAPNFMIH